MEYAKYFAKEMRISQSYNEGNHLPHFEGIDKDYPIDETYGDSSRNGYFKAPCTMKLVRKYGPAVGNKSVTNNIWLTSVSKVQMPSGIDYLTAFVGHISKNDMDNLKIGQIFKQGENVCREYKDQNATGAHSHVSLGKGFLKGTGWKLNNKGVWVLTTTGGTIKPEAALYVDTSKTKIINSQNLKFQTLNGSLQSQNFLGEKGYLGLGDNNEFVGKIAQFMRNNFPSYTSKAALGNYFGPNLQKAIKEFQRRTGLEADGNVGPITLKTLKTYGFKEV